MRPDVKQTTAGLTGLFGYLLHRDAAVQLLADRSLFPLRGQIDVALSARPWPRGSRFQLLEDGVLVVSPRSEDSKDTDVQTLGAPDAAAHEGLPPGMRARLL